jgi:hypothetical protein
MKPHGEHEQNFHVIGRDPLNDFLIPCVTGKFSDTKILDRTNGGKDRFYSKGSKKNTSRCEEGIFRFTYITPFSPISLFYHAARQLFQKRLMPIQNIGLAPWEEEVFDDILKLAFMHEGVRKEYLAFIAPCLDTNISSDEDQITSWHNTEMGMSFLSIKYLAEDLSLKDGQVSALNQHLRYWKVDKSEKGCYFFLSQEACKHLALSLGYAREKVKEINGINGSNVSTDFDSYQEMPLRVDHDSEHNKPVPPPASGNFYKHFNLYGERIDIDPAAQYNQNDPLCLASVTSPNHPKNRRDCVQPKEPEAFQGPFTVQQITAHADERQKLFYQVCYPDRQPNPTPEEGLQLLRQRIQRVQAALEEAQTAQNDYNALLAGMNDRMTAD